MLRKTPFYFLLSWLSVTSCLAQSDPPPATVAQAKPAAVFGYLREYLDTSPLDFRISFVVDGLTRRRGWIQFFVQRPNSFRIESVMGGVSYVTVSDGQVMTIYVPKNKKFAQFPAP